MADTNDFHAEPGVRYTLEMLVQLTGVDEGQLEIYRESGLIAPIPERASDELIFDEEALYRLRRIEFLREHQGVSLAGIRIIFELMRELNQLREEMRFLRS